MIRRTLSLLLLSQVFTSCLAIPGPEALFRSRSGKLQIWIPYIGQGDATLFIFPNGKNMLIDAGPPGAAKKYLLPLFEKLGVKTIDALIVSHYDLDHLGGVQELALGNDGQANTQDDIRIGKAYDRGGEPWDENPGFGAYLETLDRFSIPRQTLQAGDDLVLDSTVFLRCVAANGIVGDNGRLSVAIDISPSAYSGRENAASVALLLEYESFRYLTAGDLTGGGPTDGFLTPDVETALAELVGKISAVHINHHGSLSSSNEAFVSTSPQAVFIQAGESNRYRHPAEEVVSRWQDRGAEIYLTKENEMYLLEKSGKDPETIQQLSGP
jgi:competence protein ComEC